MRKSLKNLFNEMDDIKNAFIGVDLQNDFGHKNGSLYVKGGEELVGVINKFLKKFYNGLVIWTADCHPVNHCSFITNGGSWPSHCVDNEWGQEFLDELDVYGIDIVIRKGLNTLVDSYSAFYDNDKKSETKLREILEEEDIKNVVVMGLATDYCVKFTVLDAIQLGYNVYVYLPGCRGVNLNDGDIDKAIQEMEDAGAVIIEE